MTTDRSGPDPVLDEWTEDTGAGIFYRDYSYEITGTDTQVEQEIPVTQNGEQEDDWSYTAEILPLQDHQGNDLDSATEALYWTVKTVFRETEIGASDSGASTGTVTLSTTATTVQEGDQVVYTLTRVDGKRAEEITVQVRTWEPNRNSGGTNPSQEFHTVVIPPWEATATLTVQAYVDTDEEPGSDRLRARITSVTGGSYERETGDFIAVEINDPPGTSAAVTLTVDNTGINEGQDAVFTFTRTGGDTTQALTVGIRVDDAHGFLRGNHWDPSPDIPTEVAFAANETARTMTLTAPDDERDVAAGAFSVTVLPGSGYHPANTGLSTRAEVIVVDNDVPQELSFQWGWIDFGDSDWEPGQSYLQCSGTCMNGPAEGTWHYSDGRTFDFYNEVETYWPVHFQVSRRSQDKSRTAKFTVRVEHDRGWLSPRHSGWTLDPVTGKHYKDFPLTLAPGQRSVVGRIEVLDNSQDIDWNFSARILPFTDAGTGVELTSDVEAQYWSVDGDREYDLDASNAGVSLQINLLDPQPHPVPEGDQVQFPVQRKAGYALDPVTVQIRTWEPNRGSGGSNPSTQDHDVTIEAWRGHAEFTVYPYVDGVAETGTDELIAAIRSIGQVDGADRYTEGQPSRTVVEINDPPSGSTLVTVAANPTSIVEGGSATVTFTRTGGDTAQPLTVNIGVDDPDGRLRGNHWDPAPAIPTQVTFPANSTTQTITLTFPDDQRDLEVAGLVKVRVLPGTGYLLQQTGNLGTLTTLSVTDNDTAQELTLKWGRISPDSQHWEQGESYRTCDGGGTCTPGPAEGTFDYEDGRGFVVDNELQEPHPAHFLVSRRAQDAGRTATFTVRVEHNRGWDSPRHSGWPTDPETGNRYQEFPLTLTGNQRQVIGRIELLDNGLADHSLWQYPAEIKQIEDAAGGTALSAADEAQYWTVTGDRKRTIFPDLVLGTLVKIKSVEPKQVPEGQDVTITLERRFGNPLESYPVQVRTWEPNQVMADGANPTDQVHDVVFPAVPMTDQFVEYVTQTETLTVTAWDDSVYEPRDTFMASLLIPSTSSDRTLLISTKKATILDDDRPTITLSVDDTSITEGDTATFTLTRGNNTAGELLVGVSMDDPGGFLEGNFASEAVEVPSSIMFADGETTKQVAIAVPDDWRDIPDNAITFAVAQEPHYDIVGSTSLTVQVADNDVAPQVSISFNHTEVQEGTGLVLQIVRTGEDKNPLEIPITAGPVGDQRFHVIGMDPGMSLLHFTYRQPDDGFRGPDHRYAATLHPGRAEFWVLAGAVTVNGAILDNDPYVVSLEAITPPRRREEPALLPHLPERAHRGTTPGQGGPHGDGQFRLRQHPGKPDPHHSRRVLVHHPGLPDPSQRRLRRECRVHGRAAGGRRLRDRRRQLISQHHRPEQGPAAGAGVPRHGNRGQRRRRDRRHLGGPARGRAPSQDRNRRLQRPGRLHRRWPQYHP